MNKGTALKLAKDNETIANVEEKKNDDIVEERKVKRGGSVNKESEFGYRSEVNNQYVQR